MALLRDYAGLRLVIAYVANGQAAAATEIAGKINTAAPEARCQEFMKSYKASGSVIQACRDPTAYATAHPEVWQFMVDWGYGNPTYVAEDFCPLK